MIEEKRLEVLYKTLDDIRHQNGIESWYASELYPELGYKTKDTFKTALERAQESCRNSGGDVGAHFIKIVKPDGTNDIKLTRYACYLISINGNPKIEQIAFAQAYFVSQTRQLEVLQNKMLEYERLGSREKLKITEKDFAAMLVARGVTEGRDIGVIKSHGDKALFAGHTTDDMKKKLNVDPKRPLADFLPNVTLKAKDLATAMTNENTRTKGLYGRNPILEEHVSNNKNVRKALTESGIFPENLPPAEDIKKIETKHRKEIKDLEKQRKEMEKKHKMQLEAAAKKIQKGL